MTTQIDGAVALVTGANRTEVSVESDYSSSAIANGGHASRLHRVEPRFHARAPQLHGRHPRHCTQRRSHERWSTPR
jgi:hypothetical protein